MRILVLGGCGFIGSHIVDELSAAGHNLRVFGRSPEKYRESVDGVEYVFGSIYDKAQLLNALADIDIVFHLINTTLPATSNHNPSLDVKENLLATLQLLDLMIEKNVKKIVFFSSGGTVYGVPQTYPVAEDQALLPICSYGVVKVAIENYLYLYSKLHSLKYLTLRVSNPYGERQAFDKGQGVISNFLFKATQNEQLHIWGDGSVIRDFVYVTDIASLCREALKKELPCRSFNLGSGIGYSVNDIVTELETCLGKKLDVRYSGRRVHDVPKIVLDISSIKDYYHWKPTVTLNDGVNMTWRWMREFNFQD